MRCGRYKRVRSKFGGTVRRCAEFKAGRPRGSYRRAGLKRRKKRGGSHNRGKRCKLYGVNRLGRRTCLAYTSKGVAKRSGGYWGGKGGRVYGPVRMTGESPTPAKKLFPWA